MGFYYSSIFSIVPLGIAYGLLALAYLGVVRATRDVTARKPLLVGVGALFLVLPISEELWIAWNFGRACKEAGTFIHKKVQVDGFYDETSAGSLDLVRAGAYRFVEAKSDEGPIRLTLGDAGLIKEAFARYEKENPGKDPLTQDIVRVKLEDNVEALVFPKKGDSWRITKLDRPTARYWYARDSGKKIAHKVGRQQSTVVDKSANEAIALYTEIYREAPWYFIGLGSTSKVCATRESERIYKNGFLTYRDVLLPIGSISEGRK